MNLGFETETIEYKKSTSELKEAMISISSILNKKGYGTLYFGVKNNGDIIGQQIGTKTLRDISQMIANNIKPAIVPTVSALVKDDKNIIEVKFSGSDKPYSAYGKYYIRVADEDKEMNPSALKEMMIESSELDNIVRIESLDQNLKFNQLKNAFYEKELSINNNTFEKNLFLKNRNDKYNLMAYLLADKNDISIKIVKFAGINKTKMISRTEYGGKCLLVSMNQVLSYMESINETSVKIGNYEREENNLFDFSAFKEAWQNACLHNRWDKNNPPAIYIFSNRIEIISTGGLSKDLTKNEFYKGISKPVNSKLQKIFGMLGIVEQTGHGIPLIIDSYGKQAFEVMENYINVIIPFSINLINHDDVGKTLNSNEKVLNLIKNNPAITIKEMVKNSDLSDGYIRKIITRLKKEKKLTRLGSKKSGKWKIV